MTHDPATDPASPLPESTPEPVVAGAASPVPDAALEDVPLDEEPAAETSWSAERAPPVAFMEPTGVADLPEESGSVEMTGAEPEGVTGTTETELHPPGLAEEVVEVTAPSPADGGESVTAPSPADGGESVTAPSPADGGESVEEESPFPLQHPIDVFLESLESVPTVAPVDAPSVPPAPEPTRLSAPRETPTQLQEVELLEEELEPEESSHQWWLIPLVAALVLFLAGVGAGRYLNPPVLPWERSASAIPAQSTVVSMAAPVGSGPDKPATATDLGTQIPVKSPPGTSPGASSEPSAPSKPPSGELGPQTDEVTAQPQPAPGEEPELGLQYEESLPHEPEPVLPPSSTPSQPRSGAPRVAVVIDDLGYNGPVSMAIARLPEAITLAILPDGDFSRRVAHIGKETRKEVILHQPMEPMGYPRIKPGPHALLSGMGREEIRATLIRNLDQFPEAIGINNHMGSRLTQNREAMDVVMELLKERGLFFLDSRTSQTSVGYARARASGIPAARRDVFLDNVQRVAAIEARLAELEHVARVTGRAVGIGHPYNETLIALRGWLPAAAKRGIQVEGISHFLGSEPLARPAADTRRGGEPVVDKTVNGDRSMRLKSDTSFHPPVSDLKSAPAPVAPPPPKAPQPPAQSVKSPTPPAQTAKPAAPAVQIQRRPAATQAAPVPAAPAAAQPQQYIRHQPTPSPSMERDDPAAPPPVFHDPAEFVLPVDPKP
ncbi:MAG: divergent polysaccharide deacetylase family protein [Magnetococcales bacterium]|nr:divergent polysaccharide deacetylase family protein [Magnetococcales bacterium]